MRRSEAMGGIGGQTLYKCKIIYIYSEARLGYLIIFIIQRTLQRSEIYIHDFHIRILPHI